MEMQTIMVIILIAYSSKCYNFVSLHAAKKNERAEVFVVRIILLLYSCKQMRSTISRPGRFVHVCVCVFSVSFQHIAIESLALVAHTGFTIPIVWFCCCWQFAVHWFQLSLTALCKCVCGFVCSTVRVQCSLAFISFGISCFLSLGK